MNLRILRIQIFFGENWKSDIGYFLLQILIFVKTIIKVILELCTSVRNYLSVKKLRKAHHGRKIEAVLDFRRRFSQFL